MSEKESSQILRPIFPTLKAAKLRITYYRSCLLAFIPSPAGGYPRLFLERPGPGDSRQDVRGSALPETPNNKPANATPRASKASRDAAAKSDTGSPSPLQAPRSVDKSPRSVVSKPSVERRVSKIGTPPDKKPTRILKPSEIQAELNIAHEDLKKAKEKLALVEKEKSQALDDLKEAQILAEEASEKLREALMAQKWAEESSEIEKFRAVEMEQAGIEAAQKKEEEWHKEIEAVRSQHALDVAALLSATQELQRAKDELAMTSDAKNQALSHAEDATKIAEIHVEKVEILSAELVRVKSLLDSQIATEANEKNKLVEEMNLEIETLKNEFEKAKTFEMEVMEKEAILEQLNVELEAARMSESYAHNLVEEWKNRVEELEAQTAEAHRNERSASESLESAMKQLEGSNDSLHDAKSEISSLKEKVGLLEISIARQKVDLEESDRNLKMAKEEASEMTNKVESLSSDLETAKEEKIQALSNEKLAAESVQKLLEEKHKFLGELESSKAEEEKNKKAMENLASDLHEVSLEAREAKEKLISIQAKNENYDSQIEDLKLDLKATNEKYERILDDAKHEINLLTKSVEQSKQDYQALKTGWEEKELSLMNRAKKTEEENASMDKEISRLVTLLQEAQEEAYTRKENVANLNSSLKEVESEVIYLQEVLSEAKAESMKMKESLIDKENELQNVTHENDELKSREAASLQKVEELSKMLEEALSKKQAEENGELTDSEKDYDMLPKVVEFSEQNGGREEQKPKVELPFPPLQPEQSVKEEPQETNNASSDEARGCSTNEAGEVDSKATETENKEKDDNASADGEFKMWETCKIDEKDFSPERVPEQEEEQETKPDASENHDQPNGLSSTENDENGNTSPSKQQSQKKKKPLLSKFGSLLKKKGTGTPKQ
nr:WEB family protein At3g02930, chloroplastic-like [Ipomoea trifida]